MMLKICTKCKIKKGITEFYKFCLSKDKLSSICKKCCDKINKKYRKLHYKEVLKRNQDYVSRNREKVRLSRHNHYLKCKDEILNKQKENREKYNKRRRIHSKERDKKDINFHIKNSLRLRILAALKNNQKSGSTLKLLGCSIKEFKKYLESKFQLGMTWENHSLKGWHIDHIIPCASFDLSKESEQIKCFNYMNLQPLWSEENIKKSNKILIKGEEEND